MKSTCPLVSCLAEDVGPPKNLDDLKRSTAYGRLRGFQGVTIWLYLSIRVGSQNHRLNQLFITHGGFRGVLDAAPSRSPESEARTPVISRL
jgi:hypothetical protein